MRRVNSLALHRAGRHRSPRRALSAQPRSRNQVGFPAQLTQTVIPSDNPLTPEKIDLGQKLFFDGRLSADGHRGLRHLP